MTLHPIWVFVKKSPYTIPAFCSRLLVLPRNLYIFAHFGIFLWLSTQIVRKLLPDGRYYIYNISVCIIFFHLRSNYTPLGEEHNMIKVSVNRLQAGMVVAKPIVTKRGQTIASAGASLTSQLIAKLSFYRIQTVMIDENSIPQEIREQAVTLEVAEPKPEAPAQKLVAKPVTEQKTETPHPQVHPLETTSHRQRIQSTPQFQAFQTSYTRNMISLKEDFDLIIAGQVDGACDHLLSEAASLFASKTSLELFDMIHTMRSVDDSVYAHSLNVALISRAIGKWMQFSKEDLNTLTLAGLLHDIGKTQIPPEILNKQGKLTDEEFDIIRSHAKLGHKILKDTDLDLRIKLAALQHHERYDGSGYPRGLESDEIDTFASIVAIADVYDAMTAARSYRAPKCAFQVIAAFEDDGFQKYNPKVIFTFLQRVAACYNNSRVLLSDGTAGQIVYLNKNTLSRPIVDTVEHGLIDLSQSANKDLFIKAIL